MGTWGTGPFDNDAAADFAGALDDAGPERRVAMVRDVLVRTIEARGWLADADAAVAAAALVAAQCPGGEPVDTVYGPEQPMPAFPEDLRKPADEALARTATDPCGPAPNWVEAEYAEQWQAVLVRLRAVLVPPPTTSASDAARPARRAR
ncbi:DUF4259 domain-containing protein [Streptomyces pseudogriseolus]|uniref:DUF4259 domain-containing protein n=1 Tax=Streptomyces gancidicus BKS 13-15 TaxID=1284664 RepID=M3DRI2_STREZ|nr:DUF4259 domain-containing protein [Streptomyces gancidicus]EMF24212.1 hypothetical protein H114_28294 [Streptomyces gancidicus BKS 13-15]